jgi:mycoredoxin
VTEEKEAMTTPTPIMMYGTSWCGDCTRARAQLTRAGVPFVDIDIEDDPAAAAVAQETSGSRRIPVLVLPDGRVLVEPTHPELAEALGA